MDAGVSVAFKKRWPRMAEELLALATDQRFHLGDVFVWIDGETTIYNLGLQQHWKSRAKIAALDRAVRRMLDLSSKAGISRIGMPRVGAGLGGLEWARVKSVLGALGAETPIELLVFEQFVRGATSAGLPR